MLLAVTTTGAPWQPPAPLFEDCVPALPPVHDDEDADLLPGDSSHAPCPGVDRLVTLNFCMLMTSLDFFLVGDIVPGFSGVLLLLPAANDDGSVHIARPSRG